MYCVSDWYLAIASYTFPTVFIRLSPEEIEVLSGDKTSAELATVLIRKIQRAVDHLPGKCFITVDCCAPTDSEFFNKRRGAINSGLTGWEMLGSSDKIKQALRNGATTRIGVRPYRRMDRSREFRLFVTDRKVVAGSQRNLDGYFSGLEKRRDFIWSEAGHLITEIAGYLPADDIVVDVYLTSRDDIMIVDMNRWGDPTSPLLFRTWDREWIEESGLKLAGKPFKLGGEVSVSF